MKYYTLIAKKELLSMLSIDETKSLLQVFRIINALNYHMNLLKKYETGRKTMYSAYNKLEETYILASTIKESIKVLFGDGKVIFNLDNKITDENLRKTCIERKNYYDLYKTDKNLKFLEYIRNTFSYHFSSDIYNDTVTEGESKENKVIGITRSYKNGDMFYSILVDIMIKKIEKYLSENKINMEVENYLYSVVYKEAVDIYKLANSLAANICRGNTEKRKDVF
jgi:hypothetical protein